MACAGTSGCTARLRPCRVLDSMVVDLEYLGRESWMPLFVVLRPGTALDDALRQKINSAIKTALSPRFVPERHLPGAEIPRTLSGKTGTADQSCCSASPSTRWSTRMRYCQPGVSRLVCGAGQ